MASKLTNSQFLLNNYIAQELEANSQYGNESDFFEFFSASQILKEYDMSDEEIDHGICDASLDGGCDSIYVFADRVLLDENTEFFSQFKRGVNIELFIIQSKNTTSFDENVIMKWKTTCENLFDMEKDLSDYATRYNSKVRERFEWFRKAYISSVTKQPKISIHFVYVSKGENVHPNVVQQSDELKSLIHKLFPSSSVVVDVKFVGAEMLMELTNVQLHNEFTLLLSETPIANASSKVFVTLVNLAQYYKFITNEDGELLRHIFEANVRDYQGNVSVNKDIHESLENNSTENFWWLNNGATILASNVTQHMGKTLVISDPEIVNGLQTSTEIYSYFHNNTDRIDTEKRDILVRIIVPESEDSRDKIIFATNNQTPIQKSSLRATDPIHRQIEMYFKIKGLYYDRRKNYYKNQGKKAAQIISLPFLSQCLISVLLQVPSIVLRKKD